MEIWKDIKGYEGIYQVSNFGRVKSLERETNNQYGKEEHILKIEVTSCGYLRVRLYKTGEKPKHIFVHRLVAIAFIPNPHNYKYVNHKDENKLNNCVDNLEWCTAKYNSNYGTRNKRIIKKQSKPVLQYDLNKNFIKEWNSTNEVERQLGYSHQFIGKCCLGKRKSAYGYKWKYKKAV